MKSKFAKGLLIYTVVMLAVIFIGLFVFWRFIAAYELSRTAGVMDRYMETELWPELEQAAADFAEDRTPYESEEAQTQALLELLKDGELNYRKDPERYHERTPVYIIRLDKQELGRVWLKPEDGGLLSFGLPRWEVRSSGFDLGFQLGFDLSRFIKNYVIYAPPDADVTVNGIALSDGEPLNAVPPELQPFYGDLPQKPEYLVSQLGLLTEPEVDAAGTFDVEQGDGYAVITPRCDEETEVELTTLCENFVRAYIAYTSGAVEGPGQVQSYMVPGGSLYQRMTASMDGMSWIHNVTSTMSDLQIVGYEYYGSAAIVDADYVLTSGKNETDNHMRIILTQTDSGWRVANIELL